MHLACEGKPSIPNPKPSQIQRALRSLRSYGPSSYASLTDDDGSYLQVAGGGVTCLLEQYRADTGKRLRAFGDVQKKAFPDGTLLVFRAGEIPMMADEWFMADQVADAFCCFLEGREFPAGVHWRPAPGF
jgi:hypothetical protein